MPSVIQKFYTDNLALCQKAAKHSLKRKKDVNVSSKQQTLLKDFGKMCLPETFFYFFLIKDEIQISDWRDERDEKTSTHSHTHTHTHDQVQAIVFYKVQTGFGRKNATIFLRTFN